MNRVTLALAGCGLLICTPAFGQNLSERIDYVMQQRARAESRNTSKAHMLSVLLYTVRETSAWSLQNPARALGGVRAAVWDADQPVAAQALGLLTAVETLWSLEALAQHNGNQ